MASRGSLCSSAIQSSINASDSYFSFHGHCLYAALLALPSSASNYKNNQFLFSSLSVLHRHKKIHMPVSLEPMHRRYHRSAGVKTTGKKSEKIITTKQNLKTIHIFGETLDFLTIVFGFLRFSLMHYPIIAPLRGSQGQSARRA